MKRLLFCLPLCLLFAPSYPWPPLTSAHTTQPVEIDPAAGKIAGLPNPKDDVIAFLEFCLKHYDKTVKDYSLIFRKEERIAGKVEGLELVEVCYRAQPYSVFMGWHQGARDLDCSLYVEGENKNSEGKSLARGRSKKWKIPGSEDPERGNYALKTSRYAINTFGVRQTLVRVLKTWQAARAAGTLHAQYLGTHKLPAELGNRTCYKFHRTQFADVDNDAFDRAVVVDLIVYIDCETLLLAGTLVTGNEGLLGSYFFTDIKLNPVFDQGQFEASAVTNWNPASRGP
jgi:hypothetical protein